MDNRPAGRAAADRGEDLAELTRPPATLPAPDLTALGVGLSLDNFGTGCSSVTALNRLPIDSFKIDRSIIADASDNPTSASLVEGLISLGSHMDLDLIAGGIETQAQAEWLTSRWCPHGQGYYLGRPSPPAPSDRKAEPGTGERDHRLSVVAWLSRGRGTGTTIW